MEIFFIGVFGLMASLIALVILAIRKKPKKVAAIAAGAFFVVAFLGMIAAMGTPAIDPQTQVGGKAEEGSTPTSDANANKTQEELDKAMKSEAVEADFVKINAGEWKDKKVFATGKVSLVEISSPMITFTLTTEDSNGIGIYNIVTFSTLVGSVEDGSTVKIYGVVDAPTENTGIHKISATIIEQELTNNSSETAKPEPAAPTATMGQKNALAKAKEYLALSAFSSSGLVKQLEFEKFSAEDAAYAVENCGADWNDQAAKKAKSYLELTAFSRDRLIEQLKFDGFTQEQAVFGVEANGY